MTLTPERERDVDALLRAALVVDPPADLQARLRSLVSSEAFEPGITPSAVLGVPVGARAGRVGTLESEWVLYLVIACIVAAYSSIASWLGWEPFVEAAVSGGVSLALLLRALSLPDLPGLVADYAAWLTLIPLVWLLWERDRAEARSA